VSAPRWHICVTRLWLACPLRCISVHIDRHIGTYITAVYIGTYITAVYIGTYITAVYIGTYITAVYIGTYLYYLHIDRHIGTYISRLWLACPLRFRGYRIQFPINKKKPYGTVFFCWLDFFLFIGFIAYSLVRDRGAWFRYELVYVCIHTHIHISYRHTYTHTHIHMKSVRDRGAWFRYELVELVVLLN
jgi:hypothetical protein